MLQKELSREQVLHLAEQVADQIDAPIIEQGYDYFSRGMVFNIHVVDGTLVTSDVQGTRIYHVEIDLDFLVSSTCSCPATGYCKHQTATFFQMYSVFANPKTFLKEVKKPRNFTFSRSMLYQVPKIRVNPAAVQSPVLTVEKTITEHATVAQWWSFLADWTETLFNTIDSYRIAAELTTSYQRALTVSENWPKPLAQLFAIHASLFHLLAIQQYVQRENLSATSYLYLELSRISEQFVNQLEASLLATDIAALRDAYPSYLEDTLQKVKEIRSMDSRVINWLFVYRLLWWFLFNQPAWIETERTDLQRQLARPDLSAQERRKLLLMLSHLSVVTGEDQAALAQWREWGNLSLAFYLFYLKAFGRRNEWQRVLEWLDELCEVIGEADSQDFRLILGLWHEALQETNQQQRWGSVLKRFLPRSLYQYSAHLLEHQHYREWIDLQLSNQVSYLEISSDHLKLIESLRPDLLLPYYIGEINRLLEQRNRAAYKSAVRLIKKLRACFNKAQQKERWKSYIEQLTAKHSRLRAFQEELRRGNIIT
ncbi:SWIM zinc finger family protein [Brevibacillus fulvus]|uniref:SWIM-type domain-containing protein n=1 Tax=Brevibacillus fulvus TaxID=1125967 RepID=A0A939BTV0_9BACL|nr:hypothetical protein [Brevibacillus fulvus]MBM7588841.1 hypothetical protein [Brevibacillus fulvus]